MSEDYRQEVPESFVTPNEDELPEVHGVAFFDMDELTVVERPIKERNKGFVTGMWALILSILPPLFIVGLPLSIVSVSKSRKSGRSAALGIWAFIFNLIVFLATAFVVIVALGLVDGLEQICVTLVSGQEIVLPNGQTFVCPA